MSEELRPELLIDGQPDQGLPADDRGLLYGDGLFETVAFHGGRAPLWDLHMERLEHGCQALALDCPGRDRLAQEAARLVPEAGSAVVRITLTRGSGGRAYFPPARPATRRILIRRPFPDDLERQWQGIRAITWDGALEGTPSLAGLKHLNRLPQVLIAAECARRQADEAVVCDGAGRLVEGLTGNLVLVTEGRLQTPQPHPAAVAGVGLEWLRRAAGAALETGPLHRDHLGPDTGIWVINSVTGIRPVRWLDGRELPVDDWCRHWQRRWRRAVLGPDVLGPDASGPDTP